jgi:hypothetical protein
MESKKLNDCFSCGSDQVAVDERLPYFYTHKVKDLAYFVVCNFCLIRTSLFDTEEKAVEYWNGLKRGEK